jgi:hypothetical protein
MTAEQFGAYMKALDALRRGRTADREGMELRLSSVPMLPI